jgi:hypothetical protein
MTTKESSMLEQAQPHSDFSQLISASDRKRPLFPTRFVVELKSVSGDKRVCSVCFPHGPCFDVPASLLKESAFLGTIYGGDHSHSYVALEFEPGMAAGRLACQLAAELERHSIHACSCLDCFTSPAEIISQQRTEELLSGLTKANAIDIGTSAVLTFCCNQGYACYHYCQLYYDSPVDMASATYLGGVGVCQAILQFDGKRRLDIKLTAPSGQECGTPINCCCQIEIVYESAIRTTATGWYAACETGHPFWSGLIRSK